MCHFIFISINYGKQLTNFVVITEDTMEYSCSDLVFIRKCFFSRGQHLSPTFMPKTLVGPRGSSLPLKLWAGVPHNCCK